MATYSERIRELRALHGMSQQDLADRLDVNKVTISQYERGVRKPDLNVLTALCDIFNVSSDYLLGKDDVTIRIVGKEELEKLASTHTKRIPVLGRVAAGIPIDAIEDVLDWEEIPEMMAAAGAASLNRSLRETALFLSSISSYQTELTIRAVPINNHKKAPEGSLLPGF